jgi:hypothetical protein
MNAPFYLLQNYVQDYMHFLMKSEFNYPFFNGYITGVRVVIGHGGYVATEE